MIGGCVLVVLCVGWMERLVEAWMVIPPKPQQRRPFQFVGLPASFKPNGRATSLASATRPDMDSRTTPKTTNLQQPNFFYIRNNSTTTTTTATHLSPTRTVSTTTNTTWSSWIHQQELIRSELWSIVQMATTTNASSSSTSSSLSATTTALQKHLVQVGHDFALQQQQQKEHSPTRQRLVAKSPPTMVPGCTANVQIQVLLYDKDSSWPPNKEIHTNETTTHPSAPQDEYSVAIVGTCDALVSRGLLALWCRQCHGQCPIDVLHQDPNTLADEWHLRVALSPGRNDGMASLVHTTQDLVRKLLLSVKSLNMTASSSLLQLDESPLDPLLVLEQQTPFTTTGRESPFTASPPEPLRDLIGPALPTHNNDGNQNSTVASPLLDSITTDNLVSMSHQDQTVRRSPRVALLLSGGVDSSVALHLLLRQGYNVTAFYLKIWLQDEVAHLGTCPWQDDVDSCRSVCHHAAESLSSLWNRSVTVPLHTLSLQDEYQQYVIRTTMDQAKAGRTPNPDVLCNARIKFGCFYQALQHYCRSIHHTAQEGVDTGFDFIATGHYARLQRPDSNDEHTAIPDRGKEDDVVRLFRAPDPVKDQSYFLCALTQDQLRRVLFPLGQLHKHQVRELANAWGLPNRHRPDSQGLCFLGKVKFQDFMESYLGQEPGPIVNAGTGQILGQHKGVWFHTVGQRKGIGPYLFPQATALGPWYVVAKDPSRRIVYCSNDYQQNQFDQARSKFTVHDVSWITGTMPRPLYHDDNQSNNHSSSADDHPKTEWMWRLDMKIRHGPKIVRGTLQWLPDKHDSSMTTSDSTETIHTETSDSTTITTGTGTWKVRLDTKDGGLAPGQYVVFYDPTTTECLGGGIISEDHWTEFVSTVPPTELEASK